MWITKQDNIIILSYFTSLFRPYNFCNNFFF